MIDRYINQIVNDDCINVMKELPNESIDLILTDPAYNMTPRGNFGSTGGMLKKNINMKGKVFDYNFLDISEWLPECYRVLKDGTHCYIMCNHINLFYFIDVAQKVGFHFIKSLIWDKGNKIMGRAYMNCFEYILFFRKGEFKQIKDCGTPDILSIPNIKTKWGGVNLHDTEKPVELMKILISNSTDENDIVLDPFSGSSPVAIASKNLKRRFICCEIDKNIYENACERMDILERQKRLF